MGEEIERLIVSVRADTAGFRRDVEAMRGELEGPFSQGAARAGRILESALLSAVRTGRLGFDDLRRIALAAMAEIALAATRAGLGAVLGGASSAGGGGSASLGTLLAGLIGLPGRAGGGAVTPGRAYMVGERGPEVFIPTASGRIEAGMPARSSDIRLSIAINAPAGSEARALQQSGRQVARAVKRALLQAE